MDTDRLVDMARSDGLLDEGGYKRLRDQQRKLSDEGREQDLWSLSQEMGLVSHGKARALEKKLSTGAFRGKRVGNYTIRHRLGSGGMGDVYLAVAPSGQEVALKLLPKRLCHDPEHLKRFVRESKALSALEHPHITAFVDNGEVDGAPYIAMEVVRGNSIKEHLRETGALTQFEALHLLKQVGGALEFAAQQGLIHRDIKPANIVLGRPQPGEGLPFDAKVCDFGLVKFVQDSAGEDQGDESQLTLSGIALGTPHYMSPEQATGESDIDFRSDIYSLGATLYHGLMGKTLFSGRTSAVIMYKQVTAAIDVEPLRKRGADDRLVDLIRDMLRKDRTERPDTWADIISRADDIMGTQGGRGPRTDPAIAADLRPKAKVKSDTALLRRSRQWSVVQLVLSAIGFVVLLAILALALMPGLSPGARVFAATPDTLEQLLDDVARSSAVSTIQLEPGRYRTQLVLGPGHEGLTIGGTAGVTLVPMRADADVIVFEAGAKDITVHNLTIRGSGPLIRVDSGASARATGIRIVGGGQVFLGGDLQFDKSLVEGVLKVERGGTLDVKASVVAGQGPAIRAEGGDVAIARSRVLADPPVSGPALKQVGGTLLIDKVIMDSGSEQPVLVTESCLGVDLGNVILRGTQGWLSQFSQVPLVSGLTITAESRGIEWQGQYSSDWMWENIRVEAEEPLNGLHSLKLSEQGAQTRLLENLPSYP